MPAVKITQKPIGIPGDDTHFIVTQPELPEGYTPTGQETEEELAELKVESVREIEIDDMVKLIQDKLDMDVTPTTGSSKPVTSGGIKAALDAADAEIGELKENITNLVKTPEQTGADFYICDPSGNVLAEFRDGHLHTKNFDSADALTADDLTEIETAISSLDEDVSVVEANVNLLPEIKAVDGQGTDLDICDASGNVVVRFADGRIKTKKFNSVDHEIIYSGIPTNGDVIFSADDVSIGDRILLIFSVSKSQNGAYIDFKNTGGTRITYKGRPSSGDYKEYIEVYEIPSNFKQAVASCLSTEMTVYAVAKMDTDVGLNLYKIWTDKEPIPELLHERFEYRFSATNRLANPLFTSLEKYNADHQNAQIDVESALYRGVTGAAGYRIPTMCITNSGTVLVAGTHMTNAQGDYGDFSIDVARKPTGGSWSISEVVPFDSTRQSYGSVLNNEFLVDRNSGRIYLFYGTEKSCVVWWNVETSDGDFRYIYSDDDGENWSSPVSLKSLWDTDVYEYCIPSCTKGITLTDGTLVVPCFCKIGNTSSSDRNSWPLLLIKPTDGDWYFSSICPQGDYGRENECAVIEGSTPNEIWLYCRPNYDYPNSNYPVDNRRGYQKHVYSILNDAFTYQGNSYFDGNRHNCFGIDRITIDDTLIYLMSFTDTHGTLRENLTLWASLDGDTWIRVYRINKASSSGYSLPDNYNGTIGVAYEYSGTNDAEIKYQDLSSLSTLIYDSATKYIEKNIGVQDRMQMLFNKLNGID